jgi:hypothetical protein
MKAVFKRIRASGMIEGIFICMLIMIGCYTIVRVTRYGQRQLMHMQQNIDINSDADLHFVISEVSRNGDWLHDYPEGMECVVKKPFEQYNVIYKNRIYSVNKLTNGQCVGKCVGRC